jgi:drug/metabolite transporter (DMT)-like permease
MEWLAITLIIFSAVLHAAWNLLGKMQTTPSLHFFMVAALISSVLLTPLLLFYWQLLISLPYLPLIFLSGIFQVIYLATLAKSYQLLALSVAYPIIRALPVVLVPIFSWVFYSVIDSQEADTSALQKMAYLTIIIGTLLLIPKRSGIGLYQIKYLVLSALGTTGYSLTDHFILRSWALTEERPALLLSTLYILCHGWATVMVGSLYIIIRNKKLIKTVNIKQASQAGLVITGSYLLVLVAMTYANNASDIVAFRQISIPIGFVMGVFIMKEKTNKRQIISMLTLCFGLALLAFY